MAISTIQTVNRYDYLGLSTDIKPIDKTTEGSLFIETDTRDVYRFSDGTWHLMDDNIQYVWDPDLMQKVKMTQPAITAGDLNIDLTSTNDILDSILDSVGGGYKISDIDADGEPNYYGFLDRDGNWYIMKEETNQFRYYAGVSTYAANWANRDNLTYDLYSEIF